jgi:hypothetical protein
VNDDTEYVSRTTPYLACRFPNGTTAIAVHFRDYPEGWHGGFHREEERDREWLGAHPLPSDRLSLHGFTVNGHRVTYEGRLAVAFRLDERGELLAFAGYDCMEITIDGRTWRFGDEPIRHIGWAPIPPEQRLDDGALMRIWVDGAGTLRVPVSPDVPDVRLVAEGATPGSRGDVVPSRCVNAWTTFDMTPAVSRRWLYVVRG